MEVSFIYNQLKNYQAVMGYSPEKLTFEERMEVMRQYVLALSVEQTELLDELPWKPWKNYPEVTIDRDKMIAEWVDCLVFLFDQAIILGIAPSEIETKFVEVVENLFNRIQNNYSKRRNTI